MLRTKWQDNHPHSFKLPDRVYYMEVPNELAKTPKLCFHHKFAFVHLNSLASRFETDQPEQCALQPAVSVRVVEVTLRTKWQDSHFAQLHTARQGEAHGGAE